jgi:hypothetical protein
LNCYAQQIIGCRIQGHPVDDMAGFGRDLPVGRGNLRRYEPSSG